MSGQAEYEWAEEVVTKYRVAMCDDMSVPTSTLSESYLSRTILELQNNLSDELLELFGFPPRTPAEKTARELENEARVVRFEAERRERGDRWSSLLFSTSGALKDIIDLHSPDRDGHCTGCSQDITGYDWEGPGWPCQTILIIEEAQ